MSDHLKPANFLDLGLGIVVGVVAIMYFDIELSLAAMNPADPSTIPNMDPRIRFYLIPVVLFQVCGAAFLLELFLFRFLRPKTTTRIGWLLLGLSYSLVISYFLLRHLVGRDDPTFTVAIVLFLGCLISVHYWLYERKQA